MRERSNPRCPACGEPIGVYEPIWYVRPDGRAEESGLLAVRELMGEDPEPVLFHEACFPRLAGD
jgi:hypothetical protein